MTGLKAKLATIVLSVVIALSLAFGYMPGQSKNIDAWLPYWDIKNSLAALDVGPYNIINGINLFFYSLDKEGNIINAVKNPDEYKQTLQILRQKRIKIIPTFTNDIVYSDTKTVLKDPDIISKILNDSDRKDKHINQILKVAEELNADGVDIDYEKIYAKDRDAFSRFIKELALILHRQNRSLAVTVTPKTEDHRRDGPGAVDWQEVSAYADQIIIMCYNYSSRLSDPGPGCPPSWLLKIVRFAQTQVPPEKICVALGLYGYDWSQGEGKSVNLKKAIELIRENAAQVIWDKKSQTPYFIYFKSGIKHTVWFENQESIRKKIQLIKKYNLRNIAIWHLGMMDAYLAETIASFLE